MLAVACHHGSAGTKPPLSCAETAAHVFSLLEPKDDHAKEVRGVFELRCTQDKWTADVRSCVLSTVSLKDPKQCKQRLPISQRSRLEADLIDASARARDRDAPLACRTLTKVVDRMMNCDQIPRQARDAMRQGHDVMRQQWSKLGAGERAATEDGCKAAADAIRQAGMAVGCELP